MLVYYIFHAKTQDIYAGNRRLLVYYNFKKKDITVKKVKKSKVTVVHYTFKKKHKIFTLGMEDC